MPLGSTISILWLKPPEPSPLISLISFSPEPVTASTFTQNGSFLVQRSSQNVLRTSFSIGEENFMVTLRPAPPLIRSDLLPVRALL